MESSAERPAAAQLLERFQHFVKDPMLSAPHVRKKATSGSIGAPGEATLRSLHWRICLGVLPAAPNVWSDALRRLRQSWTDLHDYLRAPDGTWVDGAGPPSDWRGTTPPRVFDPLGNEAGNPWPGWYEDLELRRVIRQDVDRTFPESPYFRSQQVKNSLTNILFCFAKLHVDVSYRQGMHEILAILFWCTDLDSVKGAYSPEDPSTLPYLVLSRDHVEHDTYSLFNVLMTNMLSWYDPNLSVPAPLASSNGFGKTNGSTLIQPIVAKCSRIHDLLKKVDFELWKRMEELRIEPQIYGIRWLRLLFSREFPMKATLILWDAMFAEDLHPVLHIVDYVCLAMLLRVRESLLDADYSTFLQQLLRYPLPSDGDPRPLLVIQQAAYLRDNCTNFGGAYVRRQNQQIGAEAGAKTGTRREEEMYDNRNYSSRQLSAVTMAKQPSLSTTALLDQGRSIAEGIYGRAEALGINKAVFSALGDLKKSVQSYQAQQSSSTLSEIPASPYWETDASRNRGLDLKRLRNENLAMGDALAASLRIIQAELDRSLQPQSPAVAASLQTIEHVKDVLITKKPHFDPKYADDLMGVASRQLIGPTDENNQSMSAIPSALSLNSIKNPSPSLPSSSSLTEVKTSFKYPTAPPRTPSAQAQLEPWQDNAPKIGMPLAPAPTHMHHYQGGHGKTPDDTVPDLGNWQTTSTPIAHPLSGGNAMPRLPPTSRVTPTDHKYRQDPSHVIGYSESSAGRHRRTQSRGVEAADPLGALF